MNDVFVVRATLMPAVPTHGFKYCGKVMNQKKYICTNGHKFIDLKFS